MKHLNSIFLMLLFCNNLIAQTTSGFEEMSLPANTYWDGSDGSAKGFSSGNAWFPTVWDTSFGGFWASGFSVSTMGDTNTGNYSNPYSAITGTGNLGSASYATNYGSGYFLLTGNAKGKQLQGAQITNGTYTYKTMLNGDAFSKKFGGDNGTDPDYFRLIFKGYLEGIEKNDSIVFYLADFRSENSSEDYIVKNWTWVDFTDLGNVDSVAFYFESSDVGQFGINTPLYFCMDDLTTADSPATTAQVKMRSSLEIFPNPSTGLIHLSKPISGNMEVLNLNGQIVMQIAMQKMENTLDLSGLPVGIYILRCGSMMQKLILSRP